MPIRVTSPGGFDDGPRGDAGEEARRILLRLGQARFGLPDALTRARIAAITDVNRLEELSVRLLSASSWQDLLASP